MNNSKIDIKKYFEGDLRGLLALCKPPKKMIPRWLILISLVPSFVLVATLLIVKTNNKTIFLLINDFISNGLTFISVLLGLSLGGFILIVSYGNQNFVSKVIDLQAKKFVYKKKLDFNYLQKAVGIYAFIVLVQLSALVSLVVLSIASKISLPVNYYFALIINYLVTFSLTSILLYVAGLTYQLILNLFTLSQSSSFHLFLEEMAKHEKEKNSKKN